MKLDRWPARVLFAISLRLFRLYIRTLRYRVEDAHDVLALSRAEPVIISIWHNRLLLLPPAFARCFPHRRSVGLISASKDGDLVAAMIESFGYETIRGSTSRQGVIALRRLVQSLGHGKIVLITPDGPRGPLYEVSQGVVYVAQKSGAAVVPMHMEFNRSWRAKSWDGFFVAKPFSEVRVIFGAPLRLPKTSDPGEFERARLRVKKAMMDVVEQP
ncbi:MAG: lysophospholipid acyltransferase family protein [Verrucomicrobiota bacterium]|nr:lysophospholipid acyltransferase family protein [Verrucomicrobiota bacterium]